MKRTESRRSIRMGDMIHRELAEMLLEEIQDPRLEMVTISGVRLNKDLRFAEVLFTMSGDEAKIAAAKKALESARGYLRSGLGKRMKQKFVPDLRFTHDTFLEDMIYAKPDSENM
ncbi:MAG: 30S ribosome-binding factor RbfA [Desulfovibrio sp.]